MEMTSTKVKVPWREFTAKSVSLVLPSELSLLDVHFLCIGTDRSTGDSLGPMVGSMLKQMGFREVSGTLEEPCHAMNLDEVSAEIPQGRTVIAIDACLGQASSVGTVKFIKGPMTPGAGVGKDLGKHGDYQIEGIVNVGGFMEYFVLQNTRLSLVMNIAQRISGALYEHFVTSTSAVAVSRSMENEMDEIREEENRRNREAQLARARSMFIAADPFYPPQWAAEEFDQKVRGVKDEL